MACGRYRSRGCGLAGVSQRAGERPLEAGEGGDERGDLEGPVAFADGGLLQNPASTSRVIASFAFCTDRPMSSLAVCTVSTGVAGSLYNSRSTEDPARTRPTRARHDCSSAAS